MTFIVGTHINFSDQPLESIKNRLREVGEHIIFVSYRPTNVEIIPVR